MASGTLNFDQSASSGRYIDSKVVWSSTADSNANNSDVTAKLYVRKDHTDSTLTETTSGTWSFSLTVNGSAASGTVKLEVLTDWVLVATKTVKDIAHGSDGSKSITIKGSVTAPAGTSLAGHTTSGSGTAKLDTIPRASTITSVTDATVGSKTSIKWTPASKSFYYKVKLAIGDWVWTSSAIYPNQTSAYTYTTPNISYNTASELTSNPPSGTTTATLYTYSDSACSKQVGSADSATFTLTVPDNSTTKPAVTMTLESVSDILDDQLSGLYIEGKSKVKATLSATGKYDATIKSYSMKVGNISYDSGDGYTSGYLAPYGSLTVYGYATDSRGYTGSTSKTITVIAYSKPTIEVSVCGRCDADGNLSDSGTCLKLKAKRSYSKVISDGVQYNFCQIRYRYKLASASEYSDWTTILAEDTTSTDEVETEALLAGALAVDSSYHVQVQAVDDVGESDTVTASVPTDKVYWHRDGARNALGLGKYVEHDNRLDVAWDAHFRGDILIGDSGMTLKDYILAVISEEGG